MTLTCHIHEVDIEAFPIAVEVSINDHVIGTHHHSGNGTFPHDGYSEGSVSATARDTQGVPLTVKVIRSDTTIIDITR